MTFKSKIVRCFAYVDITGDFQVFDQRPTLRALCSFCFRESKKRFLSLLTSFEELFQTDLKSDNIVTPTKETFLLSFFFFINHLAISH